MRLSSAVRSVALFEGAKGMLVLLAGLGMLSLLHRDVGALALELLEHLHLNPAARFPSIFLDAAARLTDARLQLYALGAACYSGIRLTEAYGLWFDRAWAEWLAALSGAVYLPFEIYEIATDPRWLDLFTFLANLAVVFFMGWLLVRRRRAAGGRAPD